MVWLFIGCLRRLFPKPLHLEQRDGTMPEIYAFRQPFFTRRALEI